MPELFKSSRCASALVLLFATMKQDTIAFVKEKIAVGLSSKQMTSAWEDIQERLVEDKLASYQQSEPEFVGTHMGNRILFACVATLFCVDSAAAA